MIKTNISQLKYLQQIHGFTLLELVIVICIISVLFVMAAERLLRIEVEAERVAVQQVAGTLQSALALEIAAHVAQDKIKDLHKLIGSNPMDRLSELPHNYIGEKSGIDPATVGSRRWYFDTDENVLVYRVKNEEYFKTTLTGPARIKLKVIPIYDDINKNRRFDADKDVIKGLRIQSVDTFEWTNETFELTSFVEEEIQPN